jgi:hypothetical protein
MIDYIYLIKNVFDFKIKIVSNFDRWKNTGFLDQTRFFKKYYAWQADSAFELYN